MGRTTLHATHSSIDTAGVALVVPEKPEGANKSWRKLLTGVTAGGADAFALAGVWLDAGVVYELPADAVVVICDRFDDRVEVAMTRAEAGGLEPVKTWTLKRTLGKRVVDYIGRRLPADAATMTATRLEVKPNRRDGACHWCRGPVPAGTGRLVPFGGWTRVTHHPGHCPPPPEIVRPNKFGGLCLLCGGWVAAGSGAAVRLTAPRTITGARYSAAHDPRCPDAPVPGPPNRAASWCADCGELVGAEAGYFDLILRQPRHRICPADTVTEPTWIARLPRTAPADIEAGTVLRIQVTITAEEPDVPASVPGYRVLESETGYVAFVAVVLEVVTGRCGTRRVRVRATTPGEAADVLAAEIALVPDVRPHPEGFKARFSSEKIGTKRPWLAEITGRTPTYRFQRQFLRADIDYSQANSKGTRGVEYSWTLGVNRVYEAAWAPSWTQWVQVYLRADPAGDIVEIDEEEVLAWLDHAAVWPAI
ncbi:hypothetical protein [Nocardia wallacei]|uniref:hypothetical protein n=1 Tax=Nocardia wallacei TaxID=480035 RepID=UPI0024554E0E|nr:hypothetical protein [Nocardia wallacei]